MTALFFALRHEAAGLLKCPARWRKEKRSPFVTYRGSVGGRSLSLVITGIGAGKARRALQTLAAAETLHLVISAGYAGGVSGQVRGGDVVVGEKVVELRERSGSPSLLEACEEIELPGDLVEQCFEAAGKAGIPLKRGPIATVPRILGTPEEKARVARLGPYLSVDLETAALAGESRERKIRFLAIRGISDDKDQALPRFVSRLSRERSAFFDATLCSIINESERKSLLAVAATCRTARKAYTGIIAEFLRGGTDRP
jgi:nucleoside phosphorylase